MKKGPVELRADEEGESEIQVTDQVLGRLQHPKKEARYLKNILQTLEAFFPHKGVFCLVGLVWKV